MIAHKPTLRVENLFDEDYEAVNGFNTSDRALLLWRPCVFLSS